MKPTGRHTVCADHLRATAEKMKVLHHKLHFEGIPLDELESLGQCIDAIEREEREVRALWKMVLEALEPAPKKKGPVLSLVVSSPNDQ